MTPKKAVHSESTHYMFVTLHNAAAYVLEAAEAQELGRLYKCMSCMLFCAFTLEAYLNHLGQSELPDWPKITKHRSPRQKLEMLVERRHLSLDMSKHPFDRFGRIFEFRKFLVHATTHHLVYDAVEDGNLGDGITFPARELDTVATLDNAREFLEATQSIVRSLHPQFGYSSEPFNTEWRASGQAHPL